MIRDLSRRDLLLGSAALAASPLMAGRAGAQGATKVTIVSHQVHKLVMTEGAAGNVTADWCQRNNCQLEWITLDLNAVMDRVFREASLRESEIAFGFMLNTRATPNAMQLFEPLDALMQAEPVEDFPDMAQGLADSMLFGGKRFGIPYRQAASGLHYNEALLEERGLSGPPKTIEEFADYAARLTFKRADGTQVQGFAFEGQNYSNVVNIARAWGGWFVTPDYKMATDQPAMIKALTLMRRFYADGVIAKSFAATTQEDMISGMQDGRIGMVFFPYGRTTLFNNPEKSRFAGRFKTTMPPISAEAAGTVKGAGITEFWSMVIPKNSRQKALAWSFIREMSSKANTIKAAINGNGAVRSSTFTDPTIMAKLPYAAQEAETLRHSVVPLPPFDQAAQARDIFVEEMQLCLLGRQTPEATGKSIAERVGPLLPKI